MTTPAAGAANSNSAAIVAVIALGNIPGPFPPAAARVAGKYRIGPARTATMPFG